MHDDFGCSDMKTEEYGSLLAGICWYEIRFSNAPYLNRYTAQLGAFAQRR